MCSDAKHNIAYTLHENNVVAKQLLCCGLQVLLSLLLSVRLLHIVVEALVGGVATTLKQYWNPDIIYILVQMLLQLGLRESQARAFLKAHITTVHTRYGRPGY